MPPAALSFPSAFGPYYPWSTQPDAYPTGFGPQAADQPAWVFVNGWYIPQHFASLNGTNAQIAAPLPPPSNKVAQPTNHLPRRRPEADVSGLFPSSANRLALTSRANKAADASKSSEKSRSANNRRQAAALSNQTGGNQLTRSSAERFNQEADVGNKKINTAVEPVSVAPNTDRFLSETGQYRDWHQDRPAILYPVTAKPANKSTAGVHNHTPGWQGLVLEDIVTWTQKINEIVNLLQQHESAWRHQQAIVSPGQTIVNERRIDNLTYAETYRKLLSTLPTSGEITSLQDPVKRQVLGQIVRCQSKTFFGANIFQMIVDSVCLRCIGLKQIKEAVIGDRDHWADLNSAFDFGGSSLLSMEQSGTSLPQQPDLTEYKERRTAYYSRKKKPEEPKGRTM